MQIAAFFIEYLVTGSTALLWILLLLAKNPSTLTTFSPAQAAFLLPIVYVLGMLVDYVSYHLVHPKKTWKKLKSIFRRKTDSEHSSAAKEHGIPSATAFVIFHSSDLGKGVEMRSSRDRIARGAFLNFACLSAIIFFKPAITTALELPFRCSTFAATLVLVSLGSLGMWNRFEHLTRRFKNNAVETIQAELYRRGHRRA